MLQTKIQKKHTKYISEAQINCNVRVTSKFFLWSCWTLTVEPSFVGRLKSGSINAASEIRFLFFDVWIYMEDNSPNRVQLNCFFLFRFKYLRWGTRTSNNNLKAISRGTETCAHVCDGERKRDQGDDYLVVGEEGGGVDSQEIQVWVKNEETLQLLRKDGTLVKRWRVWVKKEVESSIEERCHRRRGGPCSQSSPVLLGQGGCWGCDDDVEFVLLYEIRANLRTKYIEK